jgi:hypothetical protein
VLRRKARTAQPETPEATAVERADNAVRAGEGRRGRRLQADALKLGAGNNAWVDARAHEIFPLFDPRRAHLIDGAAGTARSLRIVER